jgi:hypothetical protein
MAAVADALVAPPTTEKPAHRVAAFFQALGDAIAAEVGSERDTVYTQLEAVAARQLRAFNPSAHIQQDDLIDYVLGAERLCRQADLDGKFAEPPLSLYRGEHFDISALTWLDGTTSIHQHAFCGAFHVLEGSSIHSRYRFQPWQEPVFKQRAIAGQLQLRDIEVLRPGDTRVIERGDALIHSLFHLVRPSLTIVVRSITDDPNTEVQYDYRWPGLAVDPFQRHAVTLRKLQYLRLLRVLSAADLDRHLTRVLGAADLFLAYTLISEQTLISADLAAAQRLCDQCTTLPLAQRALLYRAVHNDLHSRSIVDLRRKLHDPDHRFLLALLLNVFDREELLKLVRREFQCDDPAAKVLAWVAEMTGNSERFGNLLGLDFNATALNMLDAMLRGNGLGATLSQMAQRFGVAAVEAEHAALSALYLGLKRCVLFHQLFAELDESADGGTFTLATPA